MARFVTSDLHFSHKNILNFCKDSRPFKDIGEMNSVIINNHNEMVHPLDEVYILGDIAWCSGNEAAKMLSLMHGKKYLIKGNHDHGVLKSDKFREQFEWIKDYHEIKHKGTLICMMHFPILEWNRKKFKSYMLHGHLHSKNPDILTQRIWDCGIDGNVNFCPYNLDNLLDEIEIKLDSNYI